MLHYHSPRTLTSKQLPDQHITLAPVYNMYPVGSVQRSQTGTGQGTMPPEIVPSCNIASTWCRVSSESSWELASGCQGHHSVEKFSRVLSQVGCRIISIDIERLTVLTNGNWGNY